MNWYAKAAWFIPVLILTIFVQMPLGVVNVIYGNDVNEPLILQLLEQ